MVERRRIPSLDGLRAIAIALVIVDHVSRSPGFPVAPEQTDRLAEALGALGVRIFFVISGFCIHLRCARAASLGETPRVAFFPFWKRRFWRLYPAYLAALALFAVRARTSTVVGGAGGA